MVRVISKQCLLITVIFVGFSFVCFTSSFDLMV